MFEATRSCFVLFFKATILLVTALGCCQPCTAAAQEQSACRICARSGVRVDVCKCVWISPRRIFQCTEVQGAQRRMKWKSARARFCCSWLARRAVPSHVLQICDAISGLLAIPSLLLHINSTWTKIYTATYSERKVMRGCPPEHHTGFN